MNGYPLRKTFAERTHRKAEIDLEIFHSRHTIEAVLCMDDETFREHLRELRALNTKMSEAEIAVISDRRTLRQQMDVRPPLPLEVVK